jgi:hypothetical protein
MIPRRALILSVAALPLFGQPVPGLQEWWARFRDAVSRRDAAALTKRSRFPMQWENGPTRQIKTAADFAARFDFYFTPELRDIVAKRTPVQEGRDMRTITWKARGNEYTLYFRAVTDGWALDGLSEGPP